MARPSSRDEPRPCSPLDRVPTSCTSRSAGRLLRRPTKPDCGTRSLQAIEDRLRLPRSAPRASTRKSRPASSRAPRQGMRRRHRHAPDGPGLAEKDSPLRASPARHRQEMEVVGLRSVALVVRPMVPFAVRYPHQLTSALPRRSSRASDTRALINTNATRRPRYPRDFHIPGKDGSGGLSRCRFRYFLVDRGVSERPACLFGAAPLRLVGSQVATRSFGLCRAPVFS